MGAWVLINEEAYYKAALASLYGSMVSFVSATNVQAWQPPMLTYQPPRSGDGGQVQLALLDLCLERGDFLFVSPLYHLTLAGDGLHRTGISYKRNGFAHGRAGKQIYEGKKPAFIKPLSANRTWRDIYWIFKVPQRPLVLNPYAMPATMNHGFGVKDANGLMTVDLVEVVDGDTVHIHVTNDPVGSVEVRYALDYIAATSIWNAVSRTGNLRDSTADTCVVSGVTYPAWHVAPHCKMAA